MSDETISASPVAKLRDRVRDMERDQEHLSKTTAGSLRAGNARFAKLTSAMFTVALAFAAAVLSGMYWGGRIEARVDSTRESVVQLASEIRELRVMIVANKGNP